MTQLSCYPITVTLKTPASFSDAPAMGNDSLTLGYIPGSSLRGMLAGLYLANKNADSNFRRLFVDGAVQFPNLYPANSRRLPLSAYSCKYHAGFRKDALPAFMIPSHCVVDRLWEDFLPEPPHTCLDPSCQHPLTPLDKAFYSGTDNFQSTDPILITRMSTAVVGRSGSARLGSLHSQQELAAHQDFQGFLVLSSQDFTTIKSELGGTSFHGYLGRKRAGSAQVNLDEYESEWNEPIIFNSPQYPGYSYITMTCTSDLILVDELLRSITFLTTKNFQDLINPPVPVKVIKAFAANRMVAGWLSVGKMFKENDLAITAGSTYLIQFPSENEQVMSTWMQDLQMQGLGLRRSEGFGQITFSEPLHRLSWQRLQRHLSTPTMEDFRL